MIDNQTAGWINAIKGQSSRLEELAADTEPCDVWQSCLNSPGYRRKEFAACRDCRLAKFNGGNEVRWRPSERNIKHPILEQEKRDAKRQRNEAKREKAKNKDRKRQQVNHAAERAERKTERISAAHGGSIRSTRNSGRINRDGDHSLAVRGAKLSLDTKLQTRSIHPVVRLAELDKIRNDSLNAGALAGALVIRNKFGRGVVVFAEEDLPRILPEES
jgi:hypothetical protein